MGGQPDTSSENGPETGPETGPEIAQGAGSETPPAAGNGAAPIRVVDLTMPLPTGTDADRGHSDPDSDLDSDVAPAPAPALWQAGFAALMGPETGADDTTGWQRVDASDPADLLHMVPEHALIVIYDAPEHALRLALQDGTPPGAALADWQARMGGLLRLYRRARRRVFLIDSSAFATDPGGLATALSDWLGRALTPQDPPQDLPDAQPASPPDSGSESALFHLIAAHALATLRPVQRLADELAAGGFAPRRRSGGDIGLLEAVFAEGAGGGPKVQDALAALEDQARADAELHDQQAILARQQILELQATLEQECLARIAQEDELKALPDLRARADELAALELEHLKLRATLQARERALVALSEDRRFLDLDLHARTDDLDQLRASTSWRLTAPLRGTRLLLSGGGKARHDD